MRCSPGAWRLFPGAYWCLDFLFGVPKEDCQCSTETPGSCFCQREASYSLGVDSPPWQGGRQHGLRVLALAWLNSPQEARGLLPGSLICFLSTNMRE